MTIRVLLADDHRLLREALRHRLEAESDIEVVGEAGTGREALALARRLVPDVIVLDMAMPELNGIDATVEILKRNPQIRIVALSAYDDARFVSGMLNAGASGYVLKAAAGTELLRAIRAVMRGQHYLCPEVAGAVVEGLKRNSRDQALPRRAALSHREREVLQLIAEGLRSPQIASRMHIAPATVDVHRRNIMRKLGVHSVAELTKVAIREGLTTL